MVFLFYFCLLQPRRNVLCTYTLVRKGDMFDNQVVLSNLTRDFFDHQFFLVHTYIHICLVTSFLKGEMFDHQFFQPVLTPDFFYIMILQRYLLLTVSYLQCCGSATFWNGSFFLNYSDPSF